MIVLGIDTATWTASVGISRDGVVIAERSLATRGNHGLSLPSMIEGSLADAGLESGDLDGVAVSIGPGSFTGLRIALATAKGLAFARGLPIVGVRTLPALALAAADEGLVSPVLDARKGEIYAALVEVHGGKAHSLHGEVAVPLDRWLQLIGPRACTFVGDAVEMVRPHARAEWTLLPFDAVHPRGGIVARLGEERLEAGPGDDLAALEPFYVRPSAAELKSL